MEGEYVLSLRSRTQKRRQVEAASYEYSPKATLVNEEPEKVMVSKKSQKKIRSSVDHAILANSLDENVLPKSSKKNKKTCVRKQPNLPLIDDIEECTSKRGKKVKKIVKQNNLDISDRNLNGIEYFSCLSTEDCDIPENLETKGRKKKKLNKKRSKDSIRPESENEKSTASNNYENKSPALKLKKKKIKTKNAIPLQEINSNESSTLETTFKCERSHSEVVISNTNYASGSTDINSEFSCGKSSDVSQSSQEGSSELMECMNQPVHNMQDKIFAFEYPSGTNINRRNTESVQQNKSIEKKNINGKHTLKKIEVEVRHVEKQEKFNKEKASLTPVSKVGHININLSGIEPVTPERSHEKISIEICPLEDQSSPAKKNSFGLNGKSTFQWYESSSKSKTVPSPQDIVLQEKDGTFELEKSHFSPNLSDKRQESYPRKKKSIHTTPCTQTMRTQKSFNNSINERNIAINELTTNESKKLTKNTNHTPRQNSCKEIENSPLFNGKLSAVKQTNQYFITNVKENTPYKRKFSIQNGNTSISHEQSSEKITKRKTLDFKNSPFSTARNRSHSKASIKKSDIESTNSRIALKSTYDESDKTNCKFELDKASGENPQPNQDSETCEKNGTFELEKSFFGDNSLMQSKSDNIPVKNGTFELEKSHQQQDNAESEVCKKNGTFEMEKSLQPLGGESEVSKKNGTFELEKSHFLEENSPKLEKELFPVSKHTYKTPCKSAMKSNKSHKRHNLSISFKSPPKYKTRDVDDETYTNKPNIHSTQTLELLHKPNISSNVTLRNGIFASNIPYKLVNTTSPWQNEVANISNKPNINCTQTLGLLDTPNIFSNETLRNGIFASNISYELVNTTSPWQNEAASNLHHDIKIENKSHEQFTGHTPLRARIGKQISGTSTPMSSFKTKPIGETLTTNLRGNDILSSRKIDASCKSTATKTHARTKLPNFSLIHKNAFEKMENLQENMQRKLERAKFLLSAPKLSAAKSNMIRSMKEPSNFNTKKKLCFTNSDQGPSTFKSPLPGLKKTVIKTPKPVPVKQKASERDGFTRFGFKIQSKQKVTKEEIKLAIGNKTKIAKSDVEDRRNVIKGVRSNRRFELLMKMRKK